MCNGKGAPQSPTPKPTLRSPMTGQPLPEIEPVTTEEYMRIYSGTPDVHLQRLIASSEYNLQHGAARYNPGSYASPELDEYYKTLNQNTTNQLQALRGEINRRAQSRADMARITSERTQIMQQQDEEMKRLQAAQVEAANNQDRQAAEIKAAEQQQQQQLAQARVATDAAIASMRVLQARPATKAPTAQATRQRNAGIQRPAARSRGLRIGATSAAPGAGLNIGG